MKRLFTIILSVILLSSGMLCAQKKTKTTFETIYRPVYGYIHDTLTHAPLRDVKVYAFDSMEDASLGKEALMKSRNPMNLRLKGDVVETRTDETGRYMVPARSTGVLIFCLEGRKVVVEEILGRSEVSLGRPEVRKEVSHDITDLLGKDYRRGEGELPRGRNEGVVLDMDFKAYIPQPGDKGKEARVIVERRLTDVETGEVLSSHVSAVRDGKTFHKKRRREISKGEVADSLYDTADALPPLSDTTSSIVVTDRVDTEPWKDRCFRLAYFVSMEHEGTLRPLDTLYMMTNRVDRPLKFLEYEFEPFVWEEEETTEQRRAAVSRRLVLEGEYDGTVPEILRDPSYVLKELHVKASVGQDRPYDECISLADSMVTRTMDELRTAFSDKLDDKVRVTKISQVVQDPSHGSKVEYRYVFSTGRQFSKNEHMVSFRRARNDAELEAACRQALEECMILEGASWDYAANLLASAYIRQRRPDTGLLVPYMEDPDGCRAEIVANQVLMLMSAQDFARAAALAERLPGEYAFLREVAKCMDGNVPADEESKRLLSESSPRNRVLVDMMEGNVTESTLSALEKMSQDEAVTWYLRARAHCMMHERAFTADPYVVECLERCFEISPDMGETAKFDSEINEYALKEVLGVFVL